MSNKARYWRFSSFHQLELLRASFTTHVFPRHCHQRFVIGICDDGLQQFDCRGVSNYAPRNHIVLVNPGEVHTGRSAGTRPWRYRSFYPKPALLQDVAEQLVERNPGVVRFRANVVQDDDLARELRDLHRALVSDEEPLHAESQLIWTFAKLVVRHSDWKVELKPLKRKHEAVKRAREFLADNLASKISLAELAKSSYLSQFHLLRVFRHEVGLPPYEYLTNLRISHARRLLGKGLPVAQVAQETGFADQSHLTRKFKRIVGVTPGQYARGGGQ